MNLKFKSAMRKSLFANARWTTIKHLSSPINPTKEEGILIAVYKKFGSLKELRNFLLKRSSLTPKVLNWLYVSLS